MHARSDRHLSIHTWFSAVIALVFALMLLAGAPARADDHATLDADRAHGLSEAGERLIIDVRTPREWRDTGLPQDAAAVSLHDPDGPAGFLDGVLEAVGGDRDAAIAVICRTGNRSQLAYNFLLGQGFTNVRDIAEGMAGGPNGPGWLPRGLPVEPCAQC